MKTSYVKKIIVCTCSLLVLLGGFGLITKPIKAAEEKMNITEEDVIVQGNGSHYYVFNKNSGFYSRKDFENNIKRVGQDVKIWDIEYAVENDMEKQKKRTTNDYQQYHLITNEERDDLAQAARNKGLSLVDYLKNAGVNMSTNTDYMVSALGGENRVWHYGDIMTHNERDLYFEKYNLKTNHKDNTLVGVIYCPSEDRDRFGLQRIPYRSENWRYLNRDNDHFNEFNDNYYLLFFLKN